MANNQRSAAEHSGGKPSRRFTIGFMPESEADEHELDEFEQKYGELLEVDPDTVGNARCYQFKTTDLTEIPTELAGMVLECLPESDLEGKFDDLEAAKHFAHVNRKELTLTIEDTPKFYESLKSYTGLTSLTLEHKILGPEMYYVNLMNAVSRLSHLEQLNLRENSFGTLDDVKSLAMYLNSASLTSLNLWETQLTDETFPVLAPALNRLTSLKTLNLSANRLSDQSLVLIISTIERLETLNLDFLVSDGGAPEIDFDLSEFNEHFRTLPNLKQFSFCGNQLAGQSDAIQLARFLTMCPNLRSLEFDGNFDDADYIHLRPVMTTLINLETLKMTFDKVGENLLTLVDLIGTYSNLRLLDIVPLDFADLNAFFQHLARALSHLTRLEEISFGWTPVSDIDLRLLTPEFQRLPLKSLEIVFVMDEIDLLEGLFRHLPHLERLHLSSQYISHTEDSFLFPEQVDLLISRLTSSLGSLSALKKLYLSTVESLTQEATQHLIDSLQKLPDFQELELNMRDFDHTILFDGIGSLTNLTYLYLYSIQPDGFEHLTAAISHLVNLQKLGLNFHSFNGEIDDTIPILKSLPNLTDLRFGVFNRYDRVLQDRIFEALPYLREF